MLEVPPEPKGPVCAGTFIDERDGKEYRKVTIGEQCWMKDNLAYLPSVVSGSTFSNNNPHYYVYGYVGTDIAAAKATSNYQTYGAIYNWHAATGGLDGVGVQGACPDGWFIPTDDDWKQLEMEMGMTQAQADGTMWRGTVQGQYMKSKVPASQQGTDIYGFSAMLGGRLATGVWNYVGTGGYYWTSTTPAANQSLLRYLTDANVQVNREQITLDTGFSVRCIMHDFEPDPVNQMPVAAVGESCYEAFATDARDGKIYDTVQLGSQCWFAENLAYLPAVHTTAGFSTAGNQSNPGYGVYGYSGTDVNAAKALDAYTKYGALYNWHAAATPGVCPAGWRVPSDADWQALSIFLGMTSIEAAGNDPERGYPAEVGTKMKIVPPGWDGIDSIGFRGIPAGLRTNTGDYLNENFNLIFWANTQSTATEAWLQALFLNDIGLYRSTSSKASGFSVRCIYDE